MLSVKEKILTILFAGMIFLLSSCGEKTLPLPYTQDEADHYAREIRMKSQTPDDYVMGVLKEENLIALVDRKGYSAGLDVLKYLLPLLHSEGIVDLDLWFIPRDGFVQANALLNSSRFFPDSAADLMGRADYLHLYGEHLAFLRYLYEFNSNLEEGEEKIRLTDLSSGESNVKGILYRTEAKPGINNLYIQNPLILGELAADRERDLINRMAQLYRNMDGGSFFFVAPADHFLREGGDADPLLILAEPLTIRPCSPLKGGINRSNYEKALKDFPEITFRKPAPAVIFFMRSAQRSFIKELP
ncbi:MAG: hypothetical protein JXA95_19655 [Spirochaetales bacterium]|nr:hypothetical protein [Spirochaetales bacterium]